jgi:PBP1b-binding outer membrane lipoprotein LpoB
MTMQLNKIRSIITIILVSFLLQACSSPPPREVKASIPLVTAENHLPTEQQGIPDAYWRQFDTPSIFNILINDYQITLSKPYISALGNTCRALDITEVTTQISTKRIACKQSTQENWYLTPDVTKSTIQINFYTRVSL